MVFSIQLLEALQRLGLPPTAQEAEDYYYLWCVAGQMLGIRPEIIPPTIAEAQALHARIKRRHIGPSDEGRTLTHNLLNVPRDRAGVDLRRDAARPGAAGGGRRHRGYAGNPPVTVGPGHGGRPSADGADQHWKRITPRIRPILNQVSYAILTRQLGLWSAGQPIHFDIPAQLRADWGLGAAPGSGCPMAAHRPASAAEAPPAPAFAPAGYRP